MKKEIEDILKGMNRSGNINDETLQLRDMAKLLSILAEEQAESVSIMKRQTTHLIALTWGLFIFTVVLCFFTIKLDQSTNQHKTNTTKKEQYNSPLPESNSYHKVKTPLKTSETVINIDTKINK